MPLEVYNLNETRNLYKQICCDYSETHIKMQNGSYLILTGRLYDIIASLSNEFMENRPVIPVGYSHKSVIKSLREKKYTLEQLIFFVQGASSSSLIKDSTKFDREKMNLLMWLKSMSVKPCHAAKVSVLVMKSISITLTNPKIINTVYEPSWRHIFKEDDVFIEMNDQVLRFYKKINNINYESMETFSLQYDSKDLSYVKKGGVISLCKTEFDFYNIIAAECSLFMKRNAINGCKLITTVGAFDNIDEFSDFFNNITIYQLTDYEQISMRGSALTRVMREIIDVESENIMLAHVHNTTIDTQLYFNNIYNYPYSIHDYTKRSDFDFKFKTPKYGLKSIVGISSLEETNIFATNARPPVISYEATKVYDVSDIMEMVGRIVYIVKRNKTSTGMYEIPFKFVFKRAKILKLNSMFRFDMANVDVEFIEDKKVSTNIKIQRACILK